MSNPQGINQYTKGGGTAKVSLQDMRKLLKRTTVNKEFNANTLRGSHAQPAILTGPRGSILFKGTKSLTRKQMTSTGTFKRTK